MNNRLPIYARLTVVIALLMFAISCSRQSVVGDDFKTIIRRYDQQLAVLFMTYDLKPLKDSLTASHYNRLDHRLAGFKKANRRMESIVRQIDFIEYKDDGNKRTGFPRALVKTRETWEIRHIDDKTGQVIKEVKGLEYDLSYELEQHDGVWQIDAVNVLNEKNPN